MKVLSSQDEILLLSIIKLGIEAYGVTIRRYVSQVTGKEWSIGAIYDPLYRLEEKGYIQSFLSQPTQERGGRSKRMFKVTPDGRRALMEHKKVRDELWGNLPEPVTN
ncbi:MAG: helix-turn-helix transcriptional regulator [Calditrichia bacterium]|nr:helix-turn-helix transcriptional regulator [Calditrichia bacterium]